MCVQAAAEAHRRWSDRGRILEKAQRTGKAERRQRTQMSPGIRCFGRKGDGKTAVQVKYTISMEAALELDTDLCGSRGRAALLRSVTMTGGSGNNWWEMSSCELHKDELVMRKTVTSISVGESQKCSRGSPLWI